MYTVFQKQVEVREERLKKISDNINAKKLQQEPGVCVYHRYGKIHWAKRSWFQPHWSFRGNAFG